MHLDTFAAHSLAATDPRFKFFARGSVSWHDLPSQAGDTLLMRCLTQSFSTIVPLGFRFAVIGTVLSLAIASAGAADWFGWLKKQPATEPEGPVEVLDTIEVSEYPESLPWIYAEADGTEVLSLGSDAATRAFVTILRGRNALLNDTLPAYLRGELAAPALVVLLDAEDPDVLHRGILRRQYVLPETGAALSRRKPPATPQTVWAQDRDVSVFSANLRYGAPHDDVLSRRWPYSVTTALRFVLERQYPQLPAWLVEGLDGHLRESTWLQRERAFTLAPLPWVSPRATKAVLRNPKQPVSLLPLETFFAEGPAAHPRGADDTISIYEAQAALFVRWAMEDNRREHREAFWRFAVRAADEPVTEALFVEHFGQTFRAAEDRLRAYLPEALRSEMTIDLPRRETRGRQSLRVAAEGEVGRIKAEWERLQARALAARDPGAMHELRARARNTARRGFELGDSDLALVGLRGLIEADGGNDEAARPWLEEAARGGVPRPAVYVELARVRLRAALENPGSLFGTISAGQLGGVLEMLATARTQVPLMPDVYSLMVEACAQSAVLPDPHYLTILAEGARLFPRQSELVSRVAELHAAYGQRREATDMVAHTLSLGPEPLARERLETLRTSLEEPGRFRLRPAATTAAHE